MVEVIDLGDRTKAPGNPAKEVHSREHSYGSENVLRGKFDRLVKENPGMKSAVAGMFRKY